MALISMIPGDGTVVIDGLAAPDVNFTGIDPTIHAIQWYGEIGEIEYNWDFTQGGSKPLNTTITSLEPFQSYVTQAQAIIYAYQNPVIVYSTQDGTLYDGQSFDLGLPIIITTPDTAPPAESTALIPPTPESFQELYWTGESWVVSPFPISDTLAEAQANLTGQVSESAAVNVDLQSRIYSNYSLVVSPAPGDLPCADYDMTLSAYQADQDAKVAAAVAEINAATGTTQLYSFVPRIEAVPD